MKNLLKRLQNHVLSDNLKSIKQAYYRLKTFFIDNTKGENKNGKTNNYNL